jgi:hypothetical protein
MPAQPIPGPPPGGPSPTPVGGMGGGDMLFTPWFRGELGSPPVFLPRLHQAWAGCTAGVRSASAEYVPESG